MHALFICEYTQFFDNEMQLFTHYTLTIKLLSLRININYVKNYRLFFCACLLRFGNDEVTEETKETQQQSI